MPPQTHKYHKKICFVIYVPPQAHKYRKYYKKYSLSYICPHKHTNITNIIKHILCHKNLANTIRIFFVIVKHPEIKRRNGQVVQNTVNCQKHYKCSPRIQLLEINPFHILQKHF